ncbi:unnamed protein product, partial [Mesorhabditis spiculigera]
MNKKSLRDDTGWERGELLGLVQYVNGAVKLDKSTTLLAIHRIFSARDEMAVATCCRKLIARLVELPADILKEAEWVSLLQTLTKGFSLPFPDISPESKKTGTDVEIPVYEVDPRRGSQEARLSEAVYRMNASFIGGHLLESVCQRVFPGRNWVIDSEAGAEEEQPSTSMDATQEKLQLFTKIMSCPWVGLPQRVAEQIAGVATTILVSAANSCPRSSQKQEDIQLMVESTNAHHTALDAVMPMLPDPSAFSRQTAQIYSEICEKFLQSALRMTVAKGLLAILPLLLDTNLPQLPEILWKIAAWNCLQTTPVPPQHSADVPRIVPIASPESDDLDINLWLNSAISSGMRTASGLNPANNESNVELLLIAIACLQAISSLQNPFDQRSKDELIIVATHTAKLEDPQFISQFGQLYRHLLAKKVLDKEVKQELLTALLQLFTAGENIRVCDVLTMVARAEPDLKDTEVARQIVQTAVAQADGNLGLEPAVLDLVRDLTQLLSSDDLAKLLQDLVPHLSDHIKKYLKGEPLYRDVGPIHTKLHLLHVLLKGGRELVPMERFYEAGLERKKEKKTPETPGHHLQTHVRMEMTGLDGEGYFKFLEDVAEVGLRSFREEAYPAAALPPLNTEFLNYIRKGQPTMAMMNYFFRVYNHLFTEQTRIYLQSFNAHDPGFELLMLETLSRDSACPIATRFVKCIHAELNTTGGTLATYSAFDGIFAVLASPLTFTPALCEEIVELIDFLEKRTLVVQCRDVWKCEGAVDRVQSVLQLLKNPMLNQVVPGAERRLREALIPEVADYADVYTRRVGGQPLQLEDDWQATIRHGTSGAVDPATVAMRTLHERLVIDLMLRVTLPECRSERVIQWLYKSHALQLHSCTVGVSEATKTIFQGMEQDLQVARLTALIIQLLHGMIDVRGPYSVETGRLQNVFGELLYGLFEKGDDLPWDEVPETMAEPILELCDGRIETYGATRALLDFVRRVLENTDLNDRAKRLIVGPIQQLLPQFPDWIKPQHSPISIFTGSQMLLEVLDEEPYLKTLHDVMTRCVEKVFDTGLLDDLCRCHPLRVQKTDRFAQSMLKYQPKTDDEDVDPVRKALALLTQFNTPHIHSRIAVKLADLLDKWLIFGDEELAVLKGELVAEEQLLERLVWRLRLMSVCFAYLDELASRLNGHSDDAQYYSDDEILTKQLHSILDTLGSPNRSKSEEREGQCGAEASLCTYSRTQQKFVDQHWYNCHTCTMTEAVGVCSACAVNCHRGHDLSYSKHGSFFCDCGARGPGFCRTLSRAEHDVKDTQKVVMGAVGVTKRRGPSYDDRQQLPPLERPFSGIEVKPSEETEIRNALLQLRTILDRHTDDIHNFYKAVKEASNARWLLPERRLEAVAETGEQELQHEKLMTAVLTIDDGAQDVFERRGDTSSTIQPHILIRELMGTVRLPGVGCVIVYLNEAGDQVSLIQPTANPNKPQKAGGGPVFSWRIETESLEFRAKKVLCEEQTAIVYGGSDGLVLIFNNEGEVTERHAMRLQEHRGEVPTHVTRCAWLGGDRPFLAFGGTQLVKIFDMAVDMNECIEELVLPIENFTDMAIDKGSPDAKGGYGGPKILVQATQGGFYSHAMIDRDLDNPGEGNSYYLTNQVPSPSHNNAMIFSMHYSRHLKLLFLSLSNAVHYVRVPDGDFARIDAANYHKIVMPDAVSAWHEQDGLISAIHHGKPHLCTFFYPKEGAIVTQQVELPKGAVCYTLWADRCSGSHYAIFVLDDGPRSVALYASDWASEPDFWIKGQPLEEHILESDEDDDKKEPLFLEETPSEDLVTIFESATLATKVSFSCDELGLYYDAEEVTRRLTSIGTMPLTILQRQPITVNVRLQEYNFVVRALRVEVGAGRLPAGVTILETRYDFDGEGARTFDIRFTRTQSQTIDKAFSVTIHPGEDPGQDQTAVVSIQVFGISSQDFGCETTKKALLPPLILPQQFLVRLLDLYKDTLGAGIEYRNQELAIHIGAGASGPRNGHALMADAAASMLRTAVPSMAEYYTYKDQAVFADFASTLVTLARFQTGRFYSTIRIVAQRMIQTFVAVSKADRNQAKGSEVGKMVLKHGGALPYYQLGKGLTQEADPAETIHRMGPIVQATQLGADHVDLFDKGKECHWIVELILAIARKLGGKPEKPEDDEADIIDIPAKPYRLRPDTPQACALVALDMVLISQLPARLVTSVAQQIIAHINFENGRFFVPSRDNYRQFILLRIVMVLLHKWDDFSEAKAVKKSVRIKAQDSNDEPESEGEEEPDADPTSSTSPAHKEEKPELRELCETLIQKHCLLMCFEALKQARSFWATWQEPKTDARKWSDGDQVFDLIRPYPKHWGFQDGYRLMVTELAVRLPYLIEQHVDHGFGTEWSDILCQLMFETNCTHPKVRRLCRKMLIAIHNHDKFSYRLVRGMHMLTCQIANLNKKMAESKGVALTHMQMTEMFEIVNRMAKISCERTPVWRIIACQRLEWLLSIACQLPDPISGRIVELLLIAVRAGEDLPAPELTTSLPYSEKVLDLLSTYQGQLANELIAKPKNLLLFKNLLLRYLLGRDEARRWMLHGMLRTTIQLASRANQATLLRILWIELWPVARTLGSMGAQLADLLATYAPRLLPLNDLITVSEQEVNAIRNAQKMLKMAGHDAATRQLNGLGLTWREAMLIDTSPCLVCTTRQDTTQTMKMSMIKQDSRYTSNAHLIKLAGHYEISKVIIKLSEVKRGKTIKKVVLYYCQRPVQTAIDLKTHKDEWEKAAEVTVAPGDLEINLTLPIPLSTSSLVVHFAEIHEARAGMELHCPRCSTTVQANPGICENCSENVHQCVKCRQINYDEKEPFLCPSCGFCKYARMELLVVSRPLASIPPLSSDKEYLQAQESMGKLLSEMEQTRTSLTAAKALAEALWIKEPQLPPIALHEESIEHANILMQAVPQLHPTQSSVSALSACVSHCKTVHEELCAQTQQLIAFREELRNYQNSSNSTIHKALNMGFYSTSSTCLGCICASVIHSVSLIAATCDQPGVLEKLLDNDFIWGPLLAMGQEFEPIRDDVELLLCRLTYENQRGTARLCELAAAKKINSTVLARSLLAFPDSQWQPKLKTLFKLASQNPDEETTILALLSVLEHFLEDGKPMKRRAQELHFEEKLRGPGGRYGGRTQKRKVAPKPKRRGSEESEDGDSSSQSSEDSSNWFWASVFSPFLSLRAAASKLVTSVASLPGHSGTAVALFAIGIVRSATVPPAVQDQFFKAAHFLMSSPIIRFRLFAANFHLHLANLIREESTAIYREEQKENSMDHWFGTRLRFLVEVFSAMMLGSSTDKMFLKAARKHLLEPIFEAILNLKCVTLKRTRAIDASRTALQRFLTKMIGNEPHQLLRTAVALLDKVDDFQILYQTMAAMEELLSPKESAEAHFLIQIEKDPPQEEYLQGRMTGNPYKSTDPGIGPLMRDIKNKICRDTELVTMIDDDNGIELLVANQIVPLNLPVKAVYDKVWKTDHPTQPMIVIYRLRGLLGDATEPFLNLNDAEEIAEADLAAAPLIHEIMECGGIEKALNILRPVVFDAAGRLLFHQMGKFFEILVRSKTCRKALVEAGAVDKFLLVFMQCLEAAGLDREALIKSTENVDSPMTRVFDEHMRKNAPSEAGEIAEFYLFLLTELFADAEVYPLLCGESPEMIKMLLGLYLYRPPAVVESLRRNTTLTVYMLKCPITQKMNTLLSKIIPAAAVGSDAAIEALVDKLFNIFDWEIVDAKCTRNTILLDYHTGALSSMCTLVYDMLATPETAKIKDRLLERKLVSTAVDYLLREHPPLYNTMESPEWKEYLSRPCLKTVLTLMRGLANGHERCQKAIAEKSLHMLHRLEQVASVDSVGTLAESVVDQLKANAEVAAQIEAVRLETKQKKRQMAMNMRQKQLSKMGMQMGQGSEIKVSSRKIANEPTLDEAGPSDPLESCCICRESICNTERVTCVYAFVTPVDPVPVATEYSSVSQLVFVHLDCHQSAIRRTTSRGGQDEWGKASLHNAGGLCNVLMPIPISQAMPNEFRGALHRAEANIGQVCPAAFAITRTSVFLDICSLVDRYVNQKSFSQHSHGGGRESNMQYLVSLQLLALTLDEGNLPTRTPEQRLLTFLLTTQMSQHWREEREDALRVTLNDALRPDNINNLNWPTLQPVFLTWALVDLMFHRVLVFVTDDRVNWLKENFVDALRKMGDLVKYYDDNVLPCEVFAEFADVMGLDANHEIWLDVKDI